MKKTILVFSALIVALLVLFQLSKYTYLSGDISIEIVIAIVAIIFFFIGAYLRTKTSKKQVVPSNKINRQKLEELGISKREYEVLVQIAKGLSNQEIAKTLFVSESTVKTHVSNLLIKLDARRRTQALQKAKELQILSY